MFIHSVEGGDGPSPVDRVVLRHSAHSRYVDYLIPSESVLIFHDNAAGPAQIATASGNELGGK